MLENENLKDYSKRLTKNLSDSTSTAANTLGVSEVWAKNFKALMDNPRRHGFAAEIMNNENDTNALARFSRIEKFNENKILGDDNAPRGADRIVDGVKIQSKYASSASKSVNQAFEDLSKPNDHKGNYGYWTEDNKPMQLEVPKEQYESAIQSMEEKIKQGKMVKINKETGEIEAKITDPKEAKNIIRKGSVTLQEAKNYSKFCTKESLKYDARNGAVIAMVAFGVSFIINTSLCYYRERDIKKALKESFVIGIKTGGKAFAVYMVGAQAQKIPALNNFLKQVIDFNFNGNMVGRALAEVGKKGASNAGKGAVNSTANSALRGTIITAAAMIMLTSSIEIAQMMKGQISNMQCVKNIINNASSIAGGIAGGLAGAAIGTSILPFGGTFLGGLIGGIVGGMGAGGVSKKVMDYFIKDDTLKKQVVFFEQMIVLAVLFKLNENEANEFRNIVDKIIQDDDNFFGDKFRLVEMVSHSNRILKPIVVAVVSQRPKLPVNVFDKEVVNGAFVEEISKESEK